MRIRCIIMQVFLLWTKNSMTGRKLAGFAGFLSDLCNVPLDNYTDLVYIGGS